MDSGVSNLKPYYTQQKPNATKKKTNTGIVAGATLAGAGAGAVAGRVANNLISVNDNDVFESVNKSPRIESFIEIEKRHAPELAMKDLGLLSADGEYQGIFGSKYKLGQDLLKKRTDMFEDAVKSELVHAKRALVYTGRFSGPVSDDYADAAKIGKSGNRELSKELIDQLKGFNLNDEEIKKLTYENFDEIVLANDKGFKSYIKKSLLGNNDKIALKGLDEAKTIEEVSAVIKNSPNHLIEMMDQATAKRLEHLSESNVKKTVLTEFKDLADNAIKEIKASRAGKYMAAGALGFAALAGIATYLKTKTKA